jgi:hypothetical protein
MTPDYQAAAETELEPINLLTGSAAQSYRERVLRVHAVSAAQSGDSFPTAACGHRCRSADLYDQAWDSVPIVIRCRMCSTALGDPMPVGP